MKSRYHWIFLVILALLTSEWTPPVPASAVMGAASGGGVSGTGGSDPLAAVSVGQTQEGGWQVRLELAAMPDDLRVTLNGRRADHGVRGAMEQSTDLSAGQGKPEPQKFLPAR